MNPASARVGLPDALLPASVRAGCYRRSRLPATGSATRGPFRSGRLTLMAACALLPTATPAAAVLTLQSRSAGLDLPSQAEARTEFEVGDVDGDGELDLVSVGDHGSPFVNSDQHGIMVWLGDGAGNWSVRQFGNFGYGGCALGDLDRDGFLDVAWGIHHNWGSGMDARLMGAARGDGSGAAWADWGQGLAANGETWGMFATALADFDGDGLLDIASQSFGGSNGIRVYRNHGDGTWSQASALTGGTVGYTVETADVDADGRMDIVSTRSGATVLLGDGTFGFTVQTAGLPASGIRGIAVGDIDEDGAVDLSFASGSSGVRAFSFDGAQWNDRSSGLPASGTYQLTQLGDLDGDGHLDLVVFAGPSGQVFLGDGAGNWIADATWSMPSPGSASALRVDGDIDHDGRDDIVVSATQSGFPFYRNQLRLYSPWSEPASLTARVVSPRGGEAVRPGSVRSIRWSAAVPPAQGAASVDLELSRHGVAGPWLPIATAIPTSGGYQWIVSAPGGVDDARIRVTVTTTSGSVQATSPAGFRILGDPAGLPEGGGADDDDAGRSELTSSDEHGGADLRVSFHPVPARETVTLVALRSMPSSATMTLHDLLGREIRSLELSPGEVRAVVSLTGRSGERLAAGTYYLRVQCGRESVTRPLIVIR